MAIPSRQVDRLSVLVEAALAEFGDELHAEAARLRCAALDCQPVRADEGGFARLELPQERRQRC